jgi:methylglutaconyl-CoA hydratase
MEKYRWAHDKGLYAKVLANQVELDIDAHLQKLASYNPEALVQKKIIWEGTDDWDTLLLKRAVSGELVLSDFTKALNQFKNKEKCVL